MTDSTAALVMAGIPATNCSLFHRIRFSVGDPTAFLSIPKNGSRETTLILRDIEMQRARRSARVDRVGCPADFAPAQGLSGDRETATAQATAECLRREGIQQVVSDRTLPLIYAHMMRAAGIEVVCDTELGVLERRQKDEDEIEHLREAQSLTEEAVRLACEMVATADVRDDGVLLREGTALTSERVRAAVDIFFVERNYANSSSIIAGGPQGADCHDVGSGELRSGQPVIVDIFPQNRATRYFGDCTRTVVHGDVPERVLAMHAAVVAAKTAASAATRAGVSGEDVHAATTAAILAAGFQMGLPSEDAPDSYCAMTHGTGHGIGLDVHEPPLLDKGGPELLVGDALTIEPGLYSHAIGGVRVEDMVIVTADGCENLNRLPEGLVWA